MKYIFWTLLATIIFFDCESQDLIPFHINNLWGYKDKQGNVKIEPQYQYASRFLFDADIVAKNDTAGAIDKNNNLIIPLKYEFLNQLDTSEFLFGYRAKYFGEYNMGVITKNQKIKIAPEYKYIIKYKGCYRVTKQQDSIMGRSSIGDVRSVKSFYGLLDSNGKVLIPCRYHYVNWINDSLIVVDSSFASTDKRYLETCCALFNKKGEQLTSFEYKVFGKFIEGVAKARIGDMFGFIYPNGKVAIPVSFDYCEDFNNGYSIIKQKDKWGAINKKGKIVIEPKFEYQEVKTALKEKFGS
ncbi:MAG TPA: WG repeat-containing protein [Chitinophagaceae bacterium]